MRKVKSVFVVLHYNEKAISDTIECVESIQTSFSNRNDFRIIVVENGSGDNSATILQKKYKNDTLTQVVISQENLGFARGNNLGCRRAIEVYEPQFLIVINNDTIIKQKEFLDKLYSRYDKEAFHVLGPFIYDRNLLPQNPQLLLKTTLEEVQKEINELKKILAKMESRLYFLKNIIKQTLYASSLIQKGINKIFRREVPTHDIPVIKEELLNVGLHGSALIFTRDYYKKYNDVFYNKTFMFVEEDILLYRVLNDNLISVYYPEMEIYHKEDCSTDASLTTLTLQNKFKFSNMLDSYEVYKEMIERKIN